MKVPRVTTEDTTKTQEADRVGRTIAITAAIISKTFAKCARTQPICSNWRCAFETMRVLDAQKIEL